MSAGRPLHGSLLVLVLVAACSDPADTDPCDEPAVVCDCLGVPDGDAVEDMCGFCDADPDNDCVRDCTGEWGGPAREDMCGVCDSEPDNDCIADCAGEWGGIAAQDACGRCVGGSTGESACFYMRFFAESDAHVAADAPAENFGAATELVVDRFQREIFLRFDLGGLPGAAEVVTARLRMTAFAGRSYDGDGSVYTTWVPDDSWDEGTITWDNRPAAEGNPLGSWLLPYSGIDDEREALNDSPELAARVRVEVDDDRIVSLRLHSPSDMTRYFSREFWDEERRPTLEIGYLIGK